MIKFGTGGWRAIIGDDFTRENVQLVATGILNMLKKPIKQTSLLLLVMTDDFYPKVLQNGLLKF